MWPFTARCPETDLVRGTVDGLSYQKRLRCKHKAGHMGPHTVTVGVYPYPDWEW